MKSVNSLFSSTPGHKNNIVTHSLVSNFINWGWISYFTWFKWFERYHMWDTFCLEEATLTSNIPAKNPSNGTTKDSFELLTSWIFQNSPWWANLMKNWDQNSLIKENYGSFSSPLYTHNFSTINRNCNNQNIFVCDSHILLCLI